MEEKLFRILAALYRTLFARPSCYRLNKLLFDLSVRGMGLHNSDNDRMSGEAFLHREILGRYGKPVVLDVGANRGNYAEKIMATTQDTVLYAFEPHPATFRALQQTAARCGFEAVNCGMGDEIGAMLLYDRQAAGDGTEHASLYREVIEGIHHVPATAVEVAVSTIDDFVAERGLERITLLKIDTEGHEYQVLCGAEQTLARGMIDLIQIEFNEMNVVSRVFFRDFYNLLGRAYDAYRLLPGGLLPISRYRPLQCELFAFQNLLFVRRGTLGKQT
jgi:FkbM family methyltransferase